MSRRIVLVVLLVLNALVLLGQLWPAGAPPFARTVNIAFLAASFFYFLHALVRRPVGLEGSTRPVNSGDDRSMRPLIFVVALFCLVAAAWWFWPSVDAFPSRTGPTTLVETTHTAFRPGQVWSYRTRPGEEASRVVILRVEEAPKLGVIVHVAVEGLAIGNPNAPNGQITRAMHLPFAKTAIERSVLNKLEDSAPVPLFEEGYRTWREAYDRQDGGIFTITVAEAVALFEPRK